MSNAQALTSGNFESSVASGVSLVDFWAEWCAPCRMMTPVLDAVAADFRYRAGVYKYRRRCQDIAEVQCPEHPDTFDNERR